MRTGGGGDVIAALSTPFGEGALAVVRATGEGVVELIDRIYHGRRRLGEVRSREVVYGEICGEGGARIDDVLVSVFRGPASYTGEDVVEISGHGGVLVSQRVLRAVLGAGARLASPGEFTRRAFENGKLDLTQAEAVMDLITARSELALRAAGEQLEGRLGREMGRIRGELLALVAEVEAYIDFPEEGIEPAEGERLAGLIAGLRGEVVRLLGTAESGRVLREGLRTVLCGAPNAGKSSLLNWLAGYDRAIVSEVAGTTRDTVEEYISLRGLPLRLIDTAGLRQGGDELERAGMERTARAIERADLVLEVVDGRLRPTEVEAAAGRGCARHVLVANKADLGVDEGWGELGAIAVSAKDGTGMDELGRVVEGRVFAGGVWGGEHPVAINARHQACLERARRGLDSGLELMGRGDVPELVAMELREALGAVGEVMGRIDAEEILGEIFGRFCIGK